MVRYRPRGPLTPTQCHRLFSSEESAGSGQSAQTRLSATAAARSLRLAFFPGRIFLIYERRPHDALSGI